MQRERSHWAPHAGYAMIFVDVMLTVPGIQQDIETCLQLLQGLCEAITAVRAADIAGFVMIWRGLLSGWQVQSAREIQRRRGIRSAHRSVVSLLFKSHRNSCRGRRALRLSRLDAGILYLMQ